MTQTQTTTYAALVSAVIGRSVLMTTDVESKVYKISSLSDKVGSLKNGDKAEYLILTDANDDKVVIQMHPSQAQQLVKKGEVGFFKLIDETAGEAAPEGETAAPVVDKPKRERKVKAEKAPKEPKVTKRMRAQEIFNTATADGKARKDIIALFKSELGMSDAGASTYYQLIKGKAAAPATAEDNAAEA